MLVTSATRLSSSSRYLVGDLPVQLAAVYVDLTGDAELDPPLLLLDFLLCSMYINQYQIGQAIDSPNVTYLHLDVLVGSLDGLKVSVPLVTFEL